MAPEKPQARVGHSVDDLCRACKLERRHTVLATGSDGTIARVVCDYCGSHHNYRGGARRSARGSASRSPETRATGTPLPLVSERERSTTPMSFDAATQEDLEQMIRRVFREECGLTAVTPADKWRGGEVVLRPGRADVQEKTLPIETFFHKIVMLRNRLRVLEQQINAAELPDDVKLKLQSHITGAYGSLTSFNVLFADADDRFRGAGGSS